MALAKTARPREDIGIISVIPERLRHQCDAAVSSQARTLHAESITEALTVLRSASPRLVLLAPSLIAGEGLLALRQLVAYSRDAVTVALVGDGPPAPRTLMELGAAGIRRCLDVSKGDAWPQLRGMLSQCEDRAGKIILRHVTDILPDMASDLRHFFRVLVHDAPRTSTVRGMVSALGVKPSTLNSRFVRAGLPSPKDYLVATRLLYVAAMFDEERMTVGTVAYRLQYASPQSLGRHIRAQLGITPSEFRSRHPFNGCLERFLGSLIRPYVSTLTTFDPVRSNAHR